CSRKILRGLIGVPREDLRAHIYLPGALERALPVQTRGQSIVPPCRMAAAASAPRHPQPTACLGRPWPALLALLLSFTRLPSGSGGLLPRRGRRGSPPCAAPPSP